MSISFSFNLYSHPQGGGSKETSLSEEVSPDNIELVLDEAGASRRRRQESQSENNNNNEAGAAASSNSGDFDSAHNLSSIKLHSSDYSSSLTDSNSFPSRKSSDGQEEMVDSAIVLSGSSYLEDSAVLKVVETAPGVKSNNVAAK